MLETSARLLRLLSLLQSRRDWTGPQLAERLGVTTRTVRNDVERLRSLGYPVHAVGGVGGGYRLRGRAPPPPPPPHAHEGGGGPPPARPRPPRGGAPGPGKCG